MKQKILVIDDEISVCESLRFALDQAYDVSIDTTPVNLPQVLEREKIDVVILDLRLGEYNGIEALRDIRKQDPAVAVIMMTAFGDERASIESMKLGAFKYLAKPVDIDELQVYISQAIEFRKLSEEVSFLSDELRIRANDYAMVGSSPGMKHIYDMISKLKDIDTNVVITGESGTGKELVARAIHFSGRRGKEHFVVVNCAAIPEGLLEEEFFGHRKGSFTGAIDNKQGKLAVANRGTLFLDEIGDMPLALQGKLLRVLENKEFTPIGGIVAQKMDVRVIAATNRNLQDMIQERTFREDLFYRLNVMGVRLPPLRERKSDIPALCQEFIQKHNAEQKKTVKCLSPAAQRLLIKYDYPGNVRQLGNIIEHAMIFSQGEVIDVQMLPEELFSPDEQRETDLGITQGAATLFGDMTLRQIEKLAIGNALARCDGKKSEAARMLGISERGLRYKLKEYGLR